MNGLLIYQKNGKDFPENNRKVLINNEITTINELCT